MDATHYRVSIRIQVTGGTRAYTFTNAADAAEAKRRAVAEATVDFGLLNVGIKVEGVSVWNFETRSWDAVAEDVKPMDEMTDDEKQAEVSNMWVVAGGGRIPYFGFNGGGPASVKAKRFVRALLARHEGTREAELIRWSLNRMVADGEVITRADVLPALKILQAL
ncbi:MAG: hypothetical protein ACRED4_09685 [Brevundimonas sp.]